MNLLESTFDYDQFFHIKEYNGYTIYQKSFGELNMPGGLMVACDPLNKLGISMWFDKRVPGKFPVTAAIGVHPRKGHLLALVKVQYKDQPVKRWEMSLTEYDDPALLKKPDDFFGFPVESGFACICDAISQNSFHDFQETPFDKADIVELNKHLTELKSGNVNRENVHYVNYEVPDYDHHNIIMFPAGSGNSYYPCYWGYDENNEICCFLVDFFVIKHILK